MHAKIAKTSIACVNLHLQEVNICQVFHTCEKFLQRRREFLLKLDIQFSLLSEFLNRSSPIMPHNLHLMTFQFSCLKMVFIISNWPSGEVRTVIQANHEKCQGNREDHSWQIHSNISSKYKQYYHYII